MDLDTELEAEQRHVDYSYECLDAMKKRTQRLLAEAPADPDLIANLTRRVNQLTDGGRPLCFGRIDTDQQETWHIGRRHVETLMGDPVVVEWRAPIAEPFYRAKIDDPMGLKRRRQFVVEGRTVVSIADDRFDAAAAADGPRVRARDALLAELERARGGQMLDIVATIQAEQDEVIRAPQEGILVVQGGPGTGKTAIGLHRAAYLLYANDELARAGMLVLGPNRTFLRYIALVLPSLGEDAVVQTTMADLVPEVIVRAAESPDAQRLKGDERMAAVIARALTGRRRLLDDDIDIRVRLRRVTLRAADANAAAEEIGSRRIPYSSGREALRDRLLRLVYEQVADAAAVDADAYRDASSEIVRDAGFRRALNTLWPSVSPAGLVRELLGRRGRLDEAAGDILDARERRLLQRRAGKTTADEPWTEADVPLVDEAVDLIEGRRRTYGHVVVDEAQDLSPMQLRMLARRAPTGSMTILGDLAQGSGVWAWDRWEHLLERLPAPAGSRVVELELGYRAPGTVLDFANRMLPSIAPHLKPTESLRPGRTRPDVVHVDAASTAAVAAENAARLSHEHPSVAVVAPVALLDAVRSEFKARKIAYGEPDRHGLSRPITLIPAPSVKGLEFDAVVVVEPSAIAEDAPRGLRLVYVALTRPTQHLAVVHSRELPPGLAA